MQRLNRLGDYAQGLARLPELPAGDGDQSIRLEVGEVLAKCLYRIKIVLAQCEGSGSSGGPGVYQRHLHYVIAFRRIADVRPPILNVQVHLRTLVKMVG